VGALVAAQDDGPFRRLSAREVAVLSLMAEGLTNTGIAGRLCLSTRTIEAHIGHIMSKLEIADSGEAHRRVLAVLSYLRTTR
jgi:DNA-binding NarL/FixJ family response regulator